MLKDNLIDSNVEVVEAALLALYEIQCSGNQELVRKCSAEFEKILKNNQMESCFYLVINILLNAKSSDHILFLKNFSNLMKKLIKGGGTSLKDMSDFTVIQLLKAATSLILSNENNDRNLMESILSFVELSLERDNDMIKIECTRMISLMDNVDNSSMKPFIKEMIEILEWSEDSIAQYEALKVLEYIMRNQYRLSLFTNHNVFNNLLGSNNKMVVSLVITILIKIVKEENKKSFSIKF